MLELLLFAAPGFWLSTLFFGILGLLIGSFLNVVIYRLPKIMGRQEDNYYASEKGLPLPHTDRYNLVLPRSACPHCGHNITALENIPVVSYLLLGGKCKSCKAKISVRYPLIELLTAALSAGMIWHFGSGIGGMAAVVFAWLLVAMTFIDIDTQLLPDDMTLGLLWMGLLLNINATFAPLQEAVIGAVAGYLALWSVYWAFKLITGKDGMGYGDFKLLAALGAWMGWGMLPVVILLSSLVGSVIGIAIIVLSKLGWETKIPFGPYLAGAGLIALVWGHQIVDYYLGIM
ncbi:prepilin peptidase [Undibacterium sp. CY18W]|uniref:Prepilin leader peptidase/N-methyltransferase n=1 Tax=Undibacterium hunanense TaxID=2762292 RepID=A0ABR6ZPC3_9BURK|nr:A24 family peptidase [Undibacterium hunanense]MBC3917746.1 prepilin peptidase [Undibacterium hunanense]